MCGVKVSWLVGDSHSNEGGGGGQFFIYIYSIYIYETLDHKTSLKSLGCICSNSQKYIVWVKMIDFAFMPKIIRTLSKDHVP